MTDESRWQRVVGEADAVLARAEGPVGGAAAGTFLRRFEGLPRGFWERDGRCGRWVAWAGATARLEAARGREAPFAELRDRADALFRRLAGGDPAGDAVPGSRPRLYGGFAFDPSRRVDGGEDGVAGGAADAPSPPDLPGGLFVLPAVELRAEDGELRLAVTVAAPSGTGADEARAAAKRALARVRAVVEALPAAPEAGANGGPGRGASVREIVRQPGREAWDRMVEAALEEVAAGRLEKVVAARCLELALDRPADAVDVLLALRGGGEGTFPYLLEPVAGSFLVGAAPEIVASRRGRRFRATAVAGTVREGADPAESERLARRLLSSDKDRREHRIGVRDMREALLEVAGVAEVGQAPRVLRLQGMQHLSTGLTARLAKDLHVLELLAALHPTAAVNGRPREAALAYLRRREPFDRGWYAGPVGWFDAAGDGAFAPALRSVTTAGRRARVCAGAGIVEGSRPAAEWDETGVKLRPALRALGLGARPADRAAGIDGGAASPAPGREVAPAGDPGG